LSSHVDALVLSNTREWCRCKFLENNVNKGPTRCNSMQTFILCRVTLHVSGVMHPSSGVLKTVSATSGIRHGNGTVTSFLHGLIWIRPRRKEVMVPLPWRKPEVADTGFSTPDDGCMTPETCRVTRQRINVCILLHRVGPLLTWNHDAQNHVFKILENSLLRRICEFKKKEVMGNGVSLVVSTVQQILQGCTYWGGWHSQNIHSVHGEGDTKYSQSVRYLRSKN